MSAQDEFQFKFSLSVLNHLGRGLYRSFATVIAEAISNAWDADAERVDIKIEDDTLTIWDNGVGMDRSELANKFLKIGYTRRKNSTTSNIKNRNVLGRKGIGKLAYLSISDQIIVFTKKKQQEIISVKIDNREIDAAIDADREQQEHTLKGIDPSSETIMFQEFGTQLVFKGLRKNLVRKNIRQILATQFHFTQALSEGDKFEIYVDGEKIDLKDLKSLYGATQFMWFFDKHSQAEFNREIQLADIKHDIAQQFPLTDTFLWEGEQKKISGYVASVRKPKHLLIAGSNREFKASVSLFAGGRLRETDLVSKVTRSQLPENYLYGQIHVDDMDIGDIDRFTSSRDGVIEDDPLYDAFLVFLRKILQEIIVTWKTGRKKYGDIDPDDETIENKFDEGYMQWVKENSNIPKTDFHKHPLTQDIRKAARDNFQSYMKCFIAENLMRYYIKHKKISRKSTHKFISKHQLRESEAKTLGNITIGIRKPLLDDNKNDLNYLDAAIMAGAIDKETGKDGQPDALTADVAKHLPVRNALMHTAALTEDAKSLGSLFWDNVVRKVLGFLGDT